MPTVQRTTRKASAKVQTNSRKKSLSSALLAIGRAYEETRASAIWYESMIGGLEQSLQEYKKREWWKSPHHNPNQILASIRHNTSSIIEGLNKISTLVCEANDIENDRRRLK